MTATRCRNCNIPIRVFDYPTGPLWMHLPPGGGPEHEYCRSAVATPPDGAMAKLIEASSLGTQSAKTLRESVPLEVAEEIVRRANERRRS